MLAKEGSVCDVRCPDLLAKRCYRGDVRCQEVPVMSDVKQIGDFQVSGVRDVRIFQYRFVS